MNIQRSVLGTVCAIAVMLASTAHASTIDWTLENVTFGDGGNLTGTFSTDSTKGYLLSWDLTSTAGSLDSGFNYNAGDSYISSYTSSSFYPVAKNCCAMPPWLYVSFTNPLNTIGTDPISFVFELDTYSGPPYSNMRYAYSGYAISSAVPEPQTYAMWLAGLGLIGFITLRRKQNLAG